MGLLGYQRNVEIEPEKEKIFKNKNFLNWVLKNILSNLWTNWSFQIIDLNGKSNIYRQFN